MVTVRVPASSANLGSGYDCVGLALGLYSIVQMEEAAEPRLDVAGEGAETLSRGADSLVWRTIEQYADFARMAVPPLHISMYNHIPLARGLGSSSACIAGVLVAANAVCGNALSSADLLDAAAAIEGHPDNVTAAMLGGLTVSIMDQEHVLAAHIPTPPGLRAVVYVPNFAMSTEKARTVLAQKVWLEDAVFNLSRAMLLAAAMSAGQWRLLAHGMEDRLHQPYRQAIFPAMPYLIKAALDAGAHGACLSGAGSSILALTHAHEEAIASALAGEAAQRGVAGRTLLLDVSTSGAEVVS